MKKNPYRVYVVGNSVNFQQMFERFGMEVVDSLDDCNIVQFTGGEDVDPALYGQDPLPTTKCNPIRDRREMEVWNWAFNTGRLITGVCRGAQLNNVLMGGTLKQHVTGHTKDHTVDISYTEGWAGPITFKVSSTHHQVMYPDTDGHILAYSSSRDQGYHYEGIQYNNFRVICYQPHPEYMPGTNCERYYEWLVRKGADKCAV